GLSVLTDTAFKGLKVQGGTATVDIAAKDGTVSQLEADLVLAAIGVRGNVENLGLEDLKVEVVKSFVKVGPGFETAAKGLHAVGEPDGVVKVISAAKRGEILGCHIVGPGATDLINEVAVAMKAEATVHELHEAIHAHPTFPEAIMEAAGDALGQAIHI